MNRFQCIYYIHREALVLLDFHTNKCLLIFLHNIQILHIKYVKKIQYFFNYLIFCLFIYLIIQQTQQLFNNLQQGPPPQGRAIRPAGASSNNTTSHSSQSHGGNLVMSLQRQPQQQHQHQQMYHPQHFQVSR